MRPDPQRIVTDLSVCAYDAGIEDGIGEHESADNTHRRFVEPAQERLEAMLSAAQYLADAVSRCSALNDHIGKATMLGEAWRNYRHAALAAGYTDPAGDDYEQA